MKKWMVIALLAGLFPIWSSAAPMNEEQYVANQREKAKKSGRPFNEAKVRARFKKIDLNKDGVISADEWKAAKATRQRKKGKSAAGEQQQDQQQQQQQQKKKSGCASSCKDSAGKKCGK